MKKFHDCPKVWRDALAKSNPRVVVDLPKPPIHVGAALLSAYLGDLNVKGKILPCSMSKRLKKS